MSYDIYLTDPKTGDVVELPEKHRIRGGTYALGGTTEAHFNATWNYGEFFRYALGEKGIRMLYGLSAAAAIPVLDTAIKRLEGEPSDNYWDATEGNARKSLVDLRELVKLCPPDSIIKGD